MKDSLETYMNGLLDTKKAIIASRLSTLSYLAPEELQLFNKKLAEAPLKRKLEVLDRLILIGIDNAYLNFDGIFSSCLKDSSPEVRLKALEALEGTDDTQVVRHVIKMLIEDTDERVRASACSFLAPIALKAELGELPESMAYQLETALRSTWENESSGTECRRCALESLSYISRPYVLEAIEKAYRSEIKGLKVCSLVCMGRNLNPRWIPIIIKELVSPDQEIQLEAINACAEIANETLVPHMLPLLKSPVPVIKFATIISLGHTGGPIAEETLRSLTKSEEPDVREAAKDALNELIAARDPFHIPILD